MEIDGIRPYSAGFQSQPAVSKSVAKNESGPNKDATPDVKAAEGNKAENDSINAKPPSRDEKNEEKRSRLEAEASDKMLKTAIETANKQLKDYQRKLQCSVHEKTKRIMVKVVNTDNEEVVREIPPEKTLDLFAKVLEMAGILLDEKK